MTKFRINEKYESSNADEYIRKSYHGGWCYVVKGKENKIFTNGITADVNSLYPSVMHSASGNYYPVGLPRFYSGEEFENHLRLCNDKTKYFYFIRIRTRFYIKKNMLPCIQIKGNYFYKPEEWLETSDIFDYKTNSYYDKYYDLDGNLQKAKVTLTLTCTDYELIKKHYNLVDCEILDGCIFSAEIGIFDKYINKWKEIKENAPTPAIKQESKLFLNNLYGKLSASDDSSFKVANLVNNQIKFFTVPAHEKSRVLLL